MTLKRRATTTSACCISQLNRSRTRNLRGFDRYVLTGGMGMLGKLQEYKFKNYFNVYDKDHDGYFTRDEFVREAYAMAEIRGRDINDPITQRNVANLEG